MSSVPREPIQSMRTAGVNAYLDSVTNDKSVDARILRIWYAMHDAATDAAPAQAEGACPKSMLTDAEFIAAQATLLAARERLIESQAAEIASLRRRLTTPTKAMIQAAMDYTLEHRVPQAHDWGFLNALLRAALAAAKKEGGE